MIFHIFTFLIDVIVLNRLVSQIFILNSTNRTILLLSRNAIYLALRCRSISIFLQKLYIFMGLLNKLKRGKSLKLDHRLNRTPPYSRNNKQFPFGIKK